MEDNAVIFYKRKGKRDSHFVTNKNDNSWHYLKSVQIRTRNNYVFGHFSRSGIISDKSPINPSTPDEIQSSTGPC